MFSRMFTLLLYTQPKRIIIVNKSDLNLINSELIYKKYVYEIISIFLIVNSNTFIFIELKLIINNNNNNKGPEIGLSFSMR